MHNLWLTLAETEIIFRIVPAKIKSVKYRVNIGPIYYFADEARPLISAARQFFFLNVTNTTCYTNHNV